MARTKDGKAPKAHWSPLERATYPPGSPGDVELRERGGAVFRSDLYTVTATPLIAELGRDGPVHLSIKRNDRAAVRDWRHFQRIKNEIMGPEREAVELYPAESTLVDESNQYHLWVLPKGGRFPFGFDERMVGSPGEAAKIGARQRAFDDDPGDVDAHLHRDSVKMRQFTLTEDGAVRPATTEEAPDGDQ